MEQTNFRICAVPLTWVSWTLSRRYIRWQGGLLVYIKSHLSFRLLTNYTKPKDTQVILFELNLKNKKSMLMYFYRPHTQNKIHFLENSSITSDHYSSTYGNYMILENFNMESNIQN